ncbi:tetratricopeptide repeat protein [Luteolibacter flavescens]|uniref:Tetratricopeptide repeat protein n=1 Tax=Luteolibacter flavescens TaxID=1859460 RepID=A0ABT3FJW9_9BACT|nr:tetratricopeptide repeat protein [Luteolibacter flavescens]MCW1883869.1 tetratricopeptide repeat protein [Luteolibacter flavescens]
MKWGLYVVLIIGVVFAWGKFAAAGSRIEETQKKWEEVHNSGEDPDQANKLKGEVRSAENDRTMMGVLLAFMSTGLIGIVVVGHVLPMLAHRVTHAVYDSGEEVEADPMHDARSKVAQGDWEGAIECFRQAAAAEPLNRLPWVEISKIQLEQLEDPHAAVQTLRHAIEDQEWQENDAAYLMFRLAEVYDTKLGDRGSAATTMQQVMEQFPETRHSANARHKLHEWGLV